MSKALRRTQSSKTVREVFPVQASDVDEQKYQQQVQELIDKYKIGNYKNTGSIGVAVIFGLLGFLIFSTTIYGGFAGLILGAGIGWQIGKKITYHKRRYKNPLDTQQQYLLRITCLLIYCHQLRKNKNVNVEFYSTVLERVVKEFNFAIENRLRKPYKKMVKELKKLLKKDKSQVSLLDLIQNIQIQINSFSKSQLHCKQQVLIYSIAKRVWMFFLPIFQTLDESKKPERKQLESYRKLTELLSSPQIQQIVLKYPYQAVRPVTVIGISNNKEPQLNNAQRLEKLQTEMQFFDQCQQKVQDYQQSLKDQNIGEIILKQRQLFLRRCDSLPHEDSNNIGVRKCTFKFSEQVEVMQKLQNAQDISPQLNKYSKKNENGDTQLNNATLLQESVYQESQMLGDDELTLQMINFKMSSNQDQVKQLSLKEIQSLSQKSDSAQSDQMEEIIIPINNNEENGQSNIQKIPPFQIEDESSYFEAQQSQSMMRPSVELFKRSSRPMNSVRDVKLEFDQSDIEEENSSLEAISIQILPEENKEDWRQQYWQELLRIENEPLEKNTWQLISDKPGCVVHMRKFKNQPFNIIKAFVQANFSIPVIIEAITNQNVRMKWDQNFKNFETIEHTPEYDIIKYEVKAPFGITNRDFLQKRILQLDFPVPKGAIMHFKSVEHPMAPEKKKPIRAHTFVCGYIMRPISENETSMTIINQIDMKGLIPTSMVNHFASRVPGQWMNNLTKGCNIVIKEGIGSQNMTHLIQAEMFI